MAFGAIWRHVQAKRAAHQWKVLQSHRVDAKTLMLGMVGETWQLVMARNMTRLDKTTGGNIFCLCVDGCWWCSRCFKWSWGVVVWNRFRWPAGALFVGARSKHREGVHRNGLSPNGVKAGQRSTSTKWWCNHEGWVFFVRLLLWDIRAPQVHVQNQDWGQWCHTLLISYCSASIVPH